MTFSSFCFARYINYDFNDKLIIKLDNQFVYFLLQEMLEDTFGPVTISHKVCSQSAFTFRRLFVCLFVWLFWPRQSTNTIYEHKILMHEHEKKEKGKKRRRRH